MAKNRCGFLCFLANQAKQEILAKVEETAFKIIYPIECKSKEIKQQVEENAFQLLYPMEQKHHEWKQRIEENAFLWLYPMEQKWQDFLAKEAKQKPQDHPLKSVEEAPLFLDKYPKTRSRMRAFETKKIFKEYQEQFHLQCVKQFEKMEQQSKAVNQWLVQQANKIQQYFLAKKSKLTLKVQMKQYQLNTICFLHEHQIAYLQNYYFKAMHRKLERIYDHQCRVFHRYYSLVCNRIAQYFAMLFGISNYWARASSVYIDLSKNTYIYAKESEGQE